MKIVEPEGPPEVHFCDLKPGDVFTDRDGVPHVKIREIRVVCPGDPVHAKHRHNALALSPAPWVAWIPGGHFVRHHPDAELRLGEVAAKPVVTELPIKGITS